jgi:hypothetical protein
MITTAKIFRGAQLIASFVTLVLALLLLIYIAISDASLPKQFHTPPREWIVPSLMLIGPSLLLVTATYLQIRRRQTLAIVLVFLAGIGNLVLVNLNAGLWYVSQVSISLQVLILANAASLLVTLGTALGNLILEIMSNKSGPERRGRVSQHQRCGRG